jgi:hypothetical protein
VLVDLVEREFEDHVVIKTKKLLSSTMAGGKILRHAINHKQTTVVISIPSFLTTTLTCTTHPTANGMPTRTMSTSPNDRHHTSHHHRDKRGSRRVAS